MDHDAQDSICRASVSGVQLKHVAKNLRPGYPKKKYAGNATIVITAKSGTLEFALPGVAVKASVSTTHEFVCFIPWPLFKQVLDAKHTPTSTILFEFSNGWYAINELKTASPSIELTIHTPDHSTNDVAQSSEKSPEPKVPAVINSTLDFPLLASYKYLRQFGIQRSVVNKGFAKELLEVDSLLENAARLLEPLAVTRVDLERLIDSKGDQ